MKVELGISNRHVHLTKEVLYKIFGPNYQLTNIKDLKQKGQFACLETVTIKTPKNTIENVRIIGPVRNYNQVEISKTDSFTLGLNPPIRNSGDLENSETITIIGPEGELTLKNACIIANRHLHITKEEKEKFNLNNVKKIKIKIEGEKGGILDNVYLKESENAVLELHLDTDDANAFLLKNNQELEVISDECF